MGNRSFVVGFVLVLLGLLGMNSTIRSDRVGASYFAGIWAGR